MIKVNIEVDADQFWEWFKTNADSLIQRPAPEAVDAIIDRLHAINAEFSAEVSGFLTNNSKELVITSHGEPSCFDLIVDFVRRAPEIPRWKIRSLKPPRGFDFIVASNPDLAIRDWTFVPLKRNSEFTEFGVRIEMSQSDYDRVDGHLVASIVEEGIGEVLFSACTHFEFDVSAKQESMPIEQLCEAVHAWCTLRGPSSLRKFLPDID
jgi:hypothetical protein